MSRDFQITQDLRFQVAAEVEPRSDTVRLWLGREFVDANRVETVEPDPISVATAPDRLVETIVRGILVYVVLLALFRLSGKRALSQVTTFDLVLTLIISEAVQQALVGLDILFSLVKPRSRTVERLVDGVPLLVMEPGRLHRDRMRRERADEDDILAAARELHGLRPLDEIDYAVVERGGGITVVPKRDTDE